MARDEPFTLTKWYLDCTPVDGRAMVAYWVSVAWRGWTLNWQQVLRFPAAGEPVARRSLDRETAPSDAGGKVAWMSVSLGATIRATPRVPPIRARLFDADAGRVDWTVLAPAAELTASIRGMDTVAGPGYVERIEMTALPWALPIRELRWGRWIADDAAHAVVWVDWRGSAPLSNVYLDGVRADGACVENDCVAAPGWRVPLANTRALFARSFRDIVRGVPMVDHLLPESFLALRQHTWTARVTADTPAGALPGTAIHEVVVFR